MTTAGDKSNNTSTNASSEPAGGRAPGRARCPNCGGPHRDGERFCLRCRYEFATGRLPAVPELVPLRHLGWAHWEAVVEADPDYFAYFARGRVLTFPQAHPRRVISLAERCVAIGAPSRSAATRPAIDLAGPPDDEAVSEVHASLHRLDDGSYEVVDRGSLNGTRLNDYRNPPLAPGQAFPLNDGDRLYVGAWSRITIRRAG